MTSVTLGMTGDVMLGRNVNQRQQTREPGAVWGNVLERLQSLDGLVVNLECCLSMRGEQWTRTYRPFHFRAHPDWAIPALRTAGVDCCTLANNHLLDYGERALLDTVSSLDEAGIATVGAGTDLTAALDPATVLVRDVQVAVVSFTDNTPEYGANGGPGVARIEMEPGNDRTVALVDEALSRARTAEPDLLVASLHWGPNMVETPASTYERFGRWLVDRGVDVIHGHSAHLFQGIEQYGDGLICYDMGDFVDDYAVDSVRRNDRSFLFQLLLRDGEPETLRLTPTEIADCTVCEAGTDQAKWARKRMRRLSEPYGTDFERDGEELLLDLR